MKPIEKARQYRWKNHVYKTRADKTECQRRLRKQRELEGYCKHCGTKNIKPPYKNCEDCRAIQKRYRIRHPEYNAYKTICREKIRAAAFIAYGNCCVCCGDTREMFFQLDHINNDGNKHRAMIGGRNVGGYKTFSWLKRNGYPKDIVQIMCANCHWAKTRLGRCPCQDRAVIIG